MGEVTPVKAQSLTEAVAACMAEIQPLVKGEENRHANYKFAGIDDFLNLTRPICAKHGVTIWQDELPFEVRDGSLLLRYAFTVKHGEEADGPYHRGISINAKMGSQAFGAAQSYALKNFLRSLFQISTGEKDDIDFHNTGELKNYTPPEPKAGEQKKQPAHSKLKTEIRQFVHELKGVGDWETYVAFRDSADFKRIVDECQDKLPGWWEGWDEQPDGFTPLRALIAETEHSLAEDKAALVGAG